MIVIVIIIIIIRTIIMNNDSNNNNNNNDKLGEVNNPRRIYLGNIINYFIFNPIDS